jgi:hypothetical protein
MCVLHQPLLTDEYETLMVGEQVTVGGGTFSSATLPITNSHVDYLGMHPGLRDKKLVITACAMEWPYALKITLCCDNVMAS